MFLQAIFYSTLSFLQDIAVFLQVMGVFLPPIFYSTWASSRTLPPSSKSLGALLAHCFDTWAHLDDIAALLHVTEATETMSAPFRL